MPKSAYTLVARTRRQVRSAKPREYILGDGSGNIYSDGQYLVRPRGPADENGSPTYGPVSRAFGGQANFLEHASRHVYVAPNHKGQPVIQGPVWEDMQAAGISPSVIHPNTPYRQFSRLKDIQNFKAIIIKPSGFKIAIRELAYVDARDGSLQIWLGTDESNHVDLELSVPATTLYHCYVLISFSQDLQAAASYPLVITTSTPKASTTLLDGTDRQEAWDAAPTDAAPIMFYRLVNNMPGMGTGDPYDIDFRQLVNMPGVRDGSITASKLAPGLLNYQTVQEDGADAPQQPALNFVPSGSVSVTVTDNPTDGSTDVMFASIAGGGTDTTAIHNNVAGEIAAITTKTTPINADYLLIEDSAASDAKKKITIGSLKQGYMLLKDQKTSGTGGGSFTNGADRTRDLNTVTANTITGASLSSNQFTLPAGTYRAYGWATGQNIDRHQVLFHNVTDAVDVERGTSAYSTGNIPSSSEVRAYFTITATKVFELRHRCANTVGTANGRGLPASFGTETYAVVEIVRE